MWVIAYLKGVRNIILCFLLCLSTNPIVRKINHSQETGKTNCLAHVIKKSQTNKIKYSETKKKTILSEIEFFISNEKLNPTAKTGTEIWRQANVATEKKNNTIHENMIILSNPDLPFTSLGINQMHPEDKNSFFCCEETARQKLLTRKSNFCLRDVDITVASSCEHISMQNSWVTSNFSLEISTFLFLSPGWKYYQTCRW